MEIRQLSRADIKQAAELATKTMSPQFKKVGEKFLSKNQYAKKLKDALENMEFAAAIKEKGKLIGFAHWYYADNQAFIEDLVVNPKHHRKKYGKALSNFIFQTCKNDKIKSVSMLLPFGSQSTEFAKKRGLKPISIELKKKLC